MSLLAHRKGHETELGKIQESLETFRINLPRVFELTDGLQVKDASIQDDIVELLKRVEQRLGRVRQETCRVAVIGLEKAGKSTFINAWIGGQALPTDTERCTWANTTIRNGRRFEANVIFSTKDEFYDNVNKLYNDAKLDKGKAGFPLRTDLELEKLGIPRLVIDGNDIKDIRDLGEFLDDIEPLLGEQNRTFTGKSFSDIRDKVFPYTSRVEIDPITKKRKKIGSAYAVRQVDISIPITDDALLNFTIDDLPGTNAPGNRAEKMTFGVINDNADAIVFLKNAENSPSLDNNETSIWNKIKNSDESIALSQKIFAVMTKADLPAEENGSDAHVLGAKNFRESGVPEERIFFCNARGELFKTVKEDLTFNYTEQQYKDACEKIAKLFHGGLTTGFPEFKKALYKFLKEDFPGLEQKAFEDLQQKYKEIVERVKRIMATCSDAVHSESGIGPKAYERFQELWMPDDRTEGEKGLGTMIYQKVNQKVLEAKEAPKNLDEILKKIKYAINYSKEKFLKEITEEGYISLIYNHYPKNHSTTKNEYFNKKQEALKEVIFKELAFGISANITESLWSIWNAAMQVKTEEAVEGLEAVSESDRNEFLREKLKGDIKTGQYSALKHLFPEEGKKTTASIGFTALLNSVAHAPAEYLLNSDKELDHDSIQQLLQKTCIYINMINNEEKRKELEKARNALKKNCDEVNTAANDNNKAGVLLDAIKKNAMAIDMVLDTILPGPLSLVSSIFLISVSKNRDSREPPVFAGGAGYQSKTGNNPEKKRPESDEEYAKAAVDEIKERVELFYIILEAMLFDPDFGFIGYYRSFLEEFRSDLRDELKVQGVIKQLALKYSKEIWKGETHFKDDDRSKRFEEFNAIIKKALD
jgi:hypothetical protein